MIYWLEEALSAGFNLDENVVAFDSERLVPL